MKFFMKVLVGSIVFALLFHFISGTPKWVCLPLGMITSLLIYLIEAVEAKGVNRT